MSTRLFRTTLTLESLESRTTPDGNSAGDLGIQANKLWDLGLTGQNIFIGQVEADRSAAKTINGAPFDSRYHPDVQPESVYFVDQPATKDRGYDSHPTGMAGVIVSRSADAAKKGIAVDAKLLSGATGGGPLAVRPRAYQHVAKQNQGGSPKGVPAINMSMSATHGPGDRLDGNSLPSRAVDYFSTKYDSLS